MSQKNLGPAASGSDDLMKKSDVTAAINAADGTGLTDNGSGVINVDQDCRTVPIAFHVSGTVTTGVKKPKFICPVAGTIDSMRGVCDSGASATYRVKKNGSTNGTTSASTGTSVVTTSSLGISVSAGDYIQIEVVAAGTGVDLSVTVAMIVGS
jgi:hypothetical protein